VVDWGQGLHTADNSTLACDVAETAPAHTYTKHIKTQLGLSYTK